MGIVTSANNFDFNLTPDPFNQTTRDEPNKGLLRKWVESARIDGRLNIAAMGLKEVPDEVMNMYDLTTVDNCNGEWYESVDLVRFIAADNEIEIISDNVFPDIDPNSDQPDSEEGKGNIFGGLETLDFHGNLLQSVPVGLKWLERLSVLNLVCSLRL